MPKYTPRQRTVKRGRKLQGKYATCPRYRSPKVMYFKVNVAEFDKAVLSKKYPDHNFQIFRCEGCGKLHIGTTPNDPEEATPQISDEDE